MFSARAFLISAVAIAFSTVSASATIFHPATTFLATLTISGTSATVIDSVYDTDHGSMGDPQTKAFLETYFGGPITLIGGGNCPATCAQGANNSATYSGVASALFAI